MLAQRLRETAFLTKGLKISLNDERADGESVTFQYEGGIRDFVAYINREKDAIHRSIIYLENETPDGSVEIAMQWNSSYNESVFTFANNINTTEGGSHLTGFRSALTRTLNDYARQKNLLKEKEDNLTGEDVREGLTALVSVKLKNPQFEGQTKTKLGNTEIATLVATIGQREAGASSSRRTRARGARSSRRRSTRRGHGAPRARRATSRAARACSRAARCPASWPTAPSRTRRSARSTSWRATRPAAPPSRRATARSRRSCRCAARSSTSRRRASTRCSRTRRS